MWPTVQLESPQARQVMILVGEMSDGRAVSR